MSLKGVMSNQLEIKGVGDLFHESFRDNPNGISTMSPDILHACILHEGKWGTPGSVISWHYTHDGKKKIAKQVIEAVDEEKKSIVFKMLEGDLMESYESLIIIYHVDTKAASHVVTWTFDYEKLNKDMPYPTDLMDLLLTLSQHMETHHRANSRKVPK